MDSASLLVCNNCPLQAPSDYARHSDPMLRLHCQSHQLRGSGRSLHVCLIRLHRGSTPDNHHHDYHDYHNHHNALHQRLPEPLCLCCSIHLHPWCGERQLHLLAVSLWLLWQPLRHVLWSVIALSVSLWSDVSADIDECESNPCQPPRNCTNSLNPNLPNFYQCSPCPLGYEEINSTACRCMCGLLDSISAHACQSWIRATATRVPT